MRRYVVRCEVWEDDKLIRSMEERRDQMDIDHSDGERTAGLILSFLPSWFASDAVGGGGLATLGYMCSYLPWPNADIQLFKTLGDAYDKWGASHNFADCISIVVDKDKLECNECECEHEATTSCDR